MVGDAHPTCYFQAFRRWLSRTYMAPIAYGPHRRTAQRPGGFFRALGRHATWYVPAVILLFERD
jgi:hypothetical protein